jgi:hypothetical protein
MERTGTIIPKSGAGKVQWRVLKESEQKLPGAGNRAILQSRIESQGKIFLVRCVVEDWHNPPVVVTVYRTTKLAKYWRQS